MRIHSYGCLKENMMMENKKLYTRCGHKTLRFHCNLQVQFPLARTVTMDNEMAVKFRTLYILIDSYYKLSNLQLIHY